METLQTIILVFNIICALILISLILMQHGKGADTGASFGSSASSQGIFGASGSANFLSRSTAVLATLFFIGCLSLAYLAYKQNSSSILKSISSEVEKKENVKDTKTIPNKDVNKPVIPE